MATVVLGLVGAAIGGGIGGAVVGAAIGQAIGGFVGSLIDNAIISALTPAQQQRGPRLTTTDVQSGTEGTVIDRIYGRARTGGQMIWATRFEEVVTTEESGGKGFGGPKVSTTTYSYYGNFAVAFCEGPVSGVGRIWADGKEIDRTKVDLRFYRGSETQTADPLIEAKEGVAPSYRGLVYMVFDRMLLTDYGNRFPQISAEIFRATGQLETILPGVAVIGSNEFGYDPLPVEQTNAGSSSGTFSATVSINRNQQVAATDWKASIDRLQMLCPAAQTVMLVLPWFGDDLRVGRCTVRPKVDNPTKATAPYAWVVNGVTRANALVMSLLPDGSPASGGSAADEAVIRCIRDLTARGLKITLLPFLLMDIPDANTKPNPYSANGAGVGQSALPWRGRITGSVAPGFAGTVDKTAAAASQVAAFMGACVPANFGGAGTVVTYAGPVEWSYRRFILHYAKLAQIAGGVTNFLIGSEMVALTQLRSGAAVYPFVDALKTLAADCRTLLGGTVKMGYAADWSEFHSHRPSDGTNDVYFNLDPLWSDANIDFIGIDNYFPLADWRDGTGHLDFNPAGPTTTYDQAYLKANIEGGEYFNWFYASNAARQSQTRLAITDGTYGKPWVYRQKDMRSWWLNPHKNRPGGVESASATAWVPQSKPIRFIELGCPAVDKAANQPNVFVDPKSAESSYPYFSNKARDDAMQRAWLQATINYWNDPAINPASGLYAGRMIDMAGSHVWCWDARLWPDFPVTGNWGDADNWETGHWLNGRMGAANAPETIAAILSDVGFSAYKIEPIPFAVDGITTGNLGSPRSMLEALRPVFQFDAVESDGVIKFIARAGRAPVKTIANLDLAAAENGGGRYKVTRAQETELPNAVKIRFGDPARDDQPASVEARRASGGSVRIAEMSPPVVMAENFAAGIAERELQAAWVARESVSFALPPRHLALDPGDVVTLNPLGLQIRIGDIGDAGARSVEGIRVDPLTFGPLPKPRSARRKNTPQANMKAVVTFVDGPLLRDDDRDHAAYVAGTMLPFKNGISVYRSPGSTGFQIDSALTLPAIMGETFGPLYSGPVWRWDRVNTLPIFLARGAVSSTLEEQVLNGANAILVENQDGEWEVIQFVIAEPFANQKWNLKQLLRGQRGTEHAMRDPVPTGARVLLINSALAQTGIPTGLVGVTLNWRSGPAGNAVTGSDFAQQTVTLRGNARRPYEPVQLKAIKAVNGDFGLSWIRRSRINADGWDAANAALGETVEAYDVEILNAAGTLVLRTISALSTPNFTYTAAQQITDFGAVQAAIKWRVYQISSTFGRGIAAKTG